LYYDNFSGDASNGGKVSEDRSQTCACRVGAREADGYSPFLRRCDNHVEHLSLSENTPSSISTDRTIHHAFSVYPFGRGEYPRQGAGAPGGKTCVSIEGKAANRRMPGGGREFV
jgi:hypothetical protein